ncbi:MAG: hypothetical protein CMG00_05235 [Candidatus Marinimicrobia bacterium]|nr:hypothetical protein [Candidatus Neomarinimicrobiota bacterium]|tara:strand:- start:3249 stop:5138 length:1890 start_codon:yes stop_codon:yes gene_type:complete
MILKYKTTTIFVFLMSLFLAQKKANNKVIFSNEQNIEEYKDMFDKSFEYINKMYVDSINQSELMKSAIKGMLKPLDPYTKLVVGGSKERLDMLTKGKYGGVGIRIGLLRDTLTVLSPMEDSPAYTEGIKAGDQIVKIDSIKCIGMTTRDAAKIIKGELGTKVVLEVLRHGKKPNPKKKISFELTRSNISVNDVPYYGIDENSIGYIRITRFSRNTYEDFLKALNYIDRETFSDLNNNDKWDSPERYRDQNKNGVWDAGERYSDKNKNKEWDSGEFFDDLNNNNKYDYNGRLKGLIIDLRGNSGGLLGESISILNLLIDKGQTLLYTKGKNGKILRHYKSTRAPVLSINTPIIVLVNKGSASASEIVSGVIQDLDRGVVMGRRTFGKGLVQKIKNLNDTISLKITNAKYYTPSGRLIQKQDWLDNGYLTDGLDKKDSVFYTINMNREVLGGGGISPDLESSKEQIPIFIKALWDKGVFLSFSAQYIPKKNITKDNILITDQTLNDFEEFIKELGDDFSYQLPGEREFISMKKKIEGNSAKQEKFLKFISELRHEHRVINKTEQYFKKRKAAQFKDPENRKWIINGLKREFHRILLDEKSRIGVSLEVDSEYNEAAKLLLDLDKYYSILGY